MQVLSGKRDLIGVAKKPQHVILTAILFVAPGKSIRNRVPLIEVLVNFLSLNLVGDLQ